jgi:hypothetical protein
MSIAINVITTANRTRCFTQQNEGHIHEIFKNLGGCVQLFSSRVLIFGSETETEIFSPSSITRIEIVTERDLTEFLPKQLAMEKVKMTALSSAALANAPESRADEAQVAGRANFFFEGGDMLMVWLEGARPSAEMERLMNLTRLFEQPVIIYKLPQGGIGLMNPSVMTRVLFKAGGVTLPGNAWRVEPT